EYNVDIIHPHDNLSKIIGGIAAKLTGVKSVTHCRDLLVGGVVEKMLIYYQLTFIDRIIAVSESNRSLLKIGGRIPGKVSVIYNGIDIDEIKYPKKNSIKEELDISDSGSVVGIIGVFDKCKGHIYLFQAIEELVSAGEKGLVCLVVGDGRERNVLEEFVNKKNLKEYVRFLGKRDDVPDLLASMDMVVMPSIQESFPRVPLEAMASNIPVIATTVGGLTEMIIDGETGILVPPADIASLSRAIKHLSENPELGKRLGAGGFRRVRKEFTVETNTRKTEDIYLDILKKI
ncbi:glycosyltransferase family 4 protein, partial [Candidatus Omnitrophota bacterium]